jgi:hypothetical protein
MTKLLSNLRELWKNCDLCNKLVIPTGEVMGLRPTQGDEKRHLASSLSTWERRSTLCHLDRSAA